MAQTIARNRAAERELDSREDEDRRRSSSSERLSVGSARRASNNNAINTSSSSSSSGKTDEQRQQQQPPHPLSSSKRDSAGQLGAASASDDKQLKGKQLLAATPPARRTALGPVSPNNLAPAQHSDQAAASESPDSYKANKQHHHSQLHTPQLMDRVNATLSNKAGDGTSGSGGQFADDALLSPSAAAWLSREEALQSRKTSERMKKTVQLLEEKCKELEKVNANQRNAPHCQSSSQAYRTSAHCTALHSSRLLAVLVVMGCVRCVVLLCCVVCVVQQVAVLCSDNRSLTVRFQHACEARHRVEKKLRAAEGAERDSNQQQQQQQQQQYATQQWMR